MQMFFDVFKERAVQDLVSVYVFCVSDLQVFIFWDVIPCVKNADPFMPCLQVN